MTTRAAALSVCSNTSYRGGGAESRWGYSGIHGRISTKLARVAVVVVVAVLLAATAGADTATSLGDRSGEGTTAFTGLAQSPEANLFTGALSTGISIAVPPGRKHMTPNLRLEYSSSGGPSPYGFGWNLVLGHIERTTRWGVPRCDGEHFDEFVLSLPGGATAELIADGTGSTTYRGRVEQAYVTATFFPGQNRWTAHDAAGMTYTFGDVNAARLGTLIANPPLVAFNPDGSCDFTTAWALTKIEDPSGNTMSIEWESKATTGNYLLPKAIEYGGHSSGLGHFHRVTFNWIDHERDEAPTYRRGVPQEQKVFLLHIAVWSDKVPGGLIRVYQMDHSSGGATGELRTVSVQDMPPQSFFYSDWEGSGHATAPVSLSVPSVFGSGIRETSDKSSVFRTVMDMNGDGLVDLVRSETGTGSWQVYFGETSVINGEATFAFASSATSWPAPYNLIRDVAHTGCPGHNCTTRDTFDITGDGVPDYVEATSNQCSNNVCHWRVWPGNWSSSI